MRATLALLIMSLSVGCQYIVPVKPTAENPTTLGLPFGLTYQRTMHALAAQKPGVKRSDTAELLITTDKATVRLNETQADCGTYSGKPYLKDSRTVTTVAYSVRLRDDGDATHITVNTEIAGRFQGTATHEATTELSCVSRGALERDLITKIREAPPPDFKSGPFRK